jgi:hypothetical protein
MKNFVKKIGIIAFVAVIGLGLFTSCEEPVVPTDITVTGIPSTYEGKFAYIGVAEGQNVVAIGMPQTVTNGQGKWELVDRNSDDISIEGKYSIILSIYEDMATFQSDDGKALYDGAVLSKTLKATDNTIAFSEFIKVNN